MATHGSLAFVASSPLSITSSFVAATPLTVLTPPRRPRSRRHPPIAALSLPSPPSTSTTTPNDVTSSPSSSPPVSSRPPLATIASVIAALAAAFLPISLPSTSPTPSSSSSHRTHYSTHLRFSSSLSTPLAIVSTPSVPLPSSSSSSSSTDHDIEHTPRSTTSTSTALSLSHRVNFVRQRAVSVRDAATRLYDRLTSSHGDEHSHDDHGHSDAISDSLILLLTTVIIIPLTRRFGISPILGFLAAGIFLGPNSLALIRDVRTSKALAELGVVFFLFEMGLELSTDKLKSLGADVFGLGTSQFLVTGTIISLVAVLAGIPTQTAIVLGAGLALSSSAFVLQLLAERGEVGTRFGRAAFGILLFQDLAVVPVLVLTPLLAGSGGAQAVGLAISNASIKAAVALAFIFFVGKNFLQPVFRFVAKAKSSEAFIAVILFTVLATSSLTQMLGLSDTLGAFLAGVMLAETKFRHQIEADIKPFRGLLLGLFFITVGFSIDLHLLFSKIGAVTAMVSGLLVIKTAVTTIAAITCGLSIGSSLRTGLLLSQGGEFAFVIFSLATRVKVMPSDMHQLMLLVVALSMAVTPALADFGRRISSSFERKRGLIGVRMEDADTADARDFVMLAGFGRVGQQLSEMLDAKLVRYMAFDMSPTRVIDARNKGLPVFFGDARRPEVLRSAGIERARAVVVTLDDPEQALDAVQNIRREFEDVKVFCRAQDRKHQKLLQAAGATAIVPELLEASLLLGGAVLLDYGTPIEEVNALIEEARAENVEELGISESVTATLASSFKQLVKFEDDQGTSVPVVEATDTEDGDEEEEDDDEDEAENENRMVDSDGDDDDDNEFESGETTFDDVRIEPPMEGPVVDYDVPPTKPNRKITPTRAYDDSDSDSVR